MNCPNCGSDLPEKSKYCPSCGKPVVAGDAGLTASGDVEVQRHRKLKTWHKVAIGSAVSAAVIAAIPFYMTSGITDTVEAHVKAIRAGKLDDAYGMTSNGFRKIASKEDFEGFVNRHPVLGENTQVTVASRQIKKGVGTIAGTATAKDGETRDVTFQLIKEQGSWRIISIHVDPTGLY